MKLQILIAVGLLLSLQGVRCDDDTDEGRPRASRVIGGEEADEGEFPWLVSLQGKVPSKTFFGIPLIYRKFYCGASVLNDKWILTAAHCFGDGSSESLSRRQRMGKYWVARLASVDLEAGLGDWMRHLLGKVLDIQGLQQWNVDAEHVFIHPEYNEADNWANDVALIKLSRPVPSGRDFENIRRIQLPTQGNSSFPADSQTCLMQGWGCTASGASVSSVAKEVVLPIVPNRRCSVTFGIQTANRLCAGYNLAQKGICMGDSGGPLVCKNVRDEWVQTGIASFASKHTPGQYPGVFTRVSSYVDWIQNTIRANP